MGRLLIALVTCLVLCTIIVEASGQSAVKLEHQFTPGQALRYKVMEYDTLNGEKFGGIEGVIVLRTLKVLPNGDASMSMSYQFGKASFYGHNVRIPASQTPLRFTMGKDGSIRNISHVLESSAGQIVKKTRTAEVNEEAGTDVYAPILICLYHPLSRKEIKPGDTWSFRLPSFSGDGDVQAKCTLVSTDTKIDTVPVAIFKQTSVESLDGGKSREDQIVTFSQRQGRIVTVEQVNDAYGKVSVEGATVDSNLSIHTKTKISLRLLP